MRQNKQTAGERIVKDIKRNTRKQYSAKTITSMYAKWPDFDEKEVGFQSSGRCLIYCFRKQERFRRS